MNAPGVTCSFVAVGTSIRIYGLATAAGIAARWNAPSVSAGATQTAAVAGSSALPSSGVWYEWTITGVTPGETVTLMGPTSGAYTVSMVDMDYRTDAGVTVHRMCVSGASAVSIHAAHLDSTDTLGPDVTWIGSSPTAVNNRLANAQSMSTRVTGLAGIIVQTDANDLNDWSLTTGSAWAYTLADHKRHMANFLTYHASLSLPVLCVFGPIRDPSFATGDRPYDQAQLIAAKKEAVAESTNGAYIDLTDEFTGATLAARYAANQSLLNDIVHPNKPGHGYFGGRIAAALRNAAVLRQG